MSKKELALKTMYDTVAGIEDIDNINLDNIVEFTKNDLTIKTAKKYLSMMWELNNKIKGLDVPDEHKLYFRRLFTLLASKYAESECRGILFQNLAMKNKKYIEIISKLEEEYQKERDSYNKIAKKYNEKQKEDKVCIPAISLSITVKNKALTNKECIDIMNEAIIADKETAEKYKRLSVPVDYKDKVDRVYIKKAESGVNNIIQKSKGHSLN